MQDILDNANKQFTDLGIKLVENEIPASYFIIEISYILDESINKMLELQNKKGLCHCLFLLLRSYWIVKKVSSDKLENDRIKNKRRLKRQSQATAMSA